MSRLENWLGHPTTVIRLDTELDVSKAIRAGLPYEWVAMISKRANLTTNEIERFIGSRRTLRRRGARLSVEESDRIVRIARIFALAEDVFANGERAQTWLRRPNRALDHERPLELLDTDSGARAVEQVLERIAHGVYS